MRLLTTQLEDDYLDESQFVLWGAYSDRAEYQELQVKVLDSVCGFVPTAWMRTHLLGVDNPSASREWTFAVDNIVHRSGLSFPRVSNSVVDSAMFHPSTAEISVVKLRKLWEHLLGPQDSIDSMPIFRWTRTADEEVVPAAQWARRP